MKHNPLLDELRQAFPPRPISAEGALDQRGRLYCDGVEYVRQLDGRTWEQLDPIFFARRSDGIDFLSDLHLAAALPLYLHLLVVFKPTSPVPETLLPMLTRPEPTDEPAKLFGWQKRRFEGVAALLTDAQKRVVARSLQQFVNDAPDEARPALRALRRYWGAFAPAVPDAVVTDAYTLEASGPLLCIHHERPDGAAGEVYRPGARDLWIDRANASWLAAALAECLTSPDCPEPTATLGDDSFQVFETGHRGAAFHVVNQRPERAPQGGWYWISMSRTCAERLVEELRTLERP